MNMNFRAGSSLIGWDEILEGGLAPEATVMSWRGVTGGIAAAEMGHDVIMTPSTYVYLDYYQSEPQGEPLAIGGYLPLEKVYSYEPLPQELDAEKQKHILGLQGNVWTEYIPTEEHLEYMAFPRAFAIAETGWTPAMKKDFEEFLARFAILRERYDLMKLNYFRGEYHDLRDRTD
jgi:hexosaminidase